MLSGTVVPEEPSVRILDGWNPLDPLLPQAGHLCIVLWLLEKRLNGLFSSFSGPKGLRGSGIGRERQNLSSVHEPNNARRQLHLPARANVSGRLHIYPRLRGHRVGRIIACID